MKVLVTGAAGFIGSKICQLLSERGDEVVGVDNINTYYDPNLKYARMRENGLFLPDNVPAACVVPESGNDGSEVSTQICHSELHLLVRNIHLCDLSAWILRIEKLYHHCLNRRSLIGS